MAEEDDKKTQNQPADDKSGGAKPAKQQGDQQNPPKKKRRPRKRRRKPKQKQPASEVLDLAAKKEQQRLIEQVEPVRRSVSEVKENKAQVDANPKKKRRRPKKRNNRPNKPPKPEEEFTEEEDVFADISTPPVEEKVVEEEPIAVEEPIAEEEPLDDDEFIVEEQPAPEKKFETEAELLGIDNSEPEAEKEEAFLASDDAAAPVEPEEPVAPVEATPPPELPDEIAPAEPKPAPAPAEPGPVGWDQLKQAIKSDYDTSEEQATVVPMPDEAPVAEPEVPEASEAPVPVPVPIAQAPSVEAEPEPAEEIQAQPVPIVEPTSSPSEELHADDEAEKKEIVRIIVKYAASGCIVIVLIAAIFIFKIPQGIYGLFTGGGQKQVTVVTPTTPTEPSTTTPSEKPDIEGFEEGIGTALLTGKDIPVIKKVSPGIRTSFFAGLPFSPKPGIETDRIETYINVLNKLQNAFATDLHQLLDSSANRAETLEVHLSELTSSYTDSLETFQKLNEERDELKIEFNEVTTEKNRLEKEFFAAMERLESKTTDSILGEFIDVSQRQINLKAEFNALSKASELFEVAIKNMDLRIQDIEANKEALIKGVKVVNIKGSDLDLIVQPGE